MNTNSKPLIALVDDEPEILSICSELLAPFYEVTKFESAPLLMDAIHQGYRPIVTLTDLKMPGTSGLGLARFISEQGLDCGVIMMSGFAERSDLIEAMSTNVTGFIDKPFDPADLIKKMQFAYDRQRRLLVFKEFVSQLNALNQDQSDLNTAYYDRLAELENLIIDSLPKQYEEQRFKEKYLSFLKHTGNLTRRITFSKNLISRVSQKFQAPTQSIGGQEKLLKST